MAVCNTTLMDLGEEAVEHELPLWGNWTFHELGLLLSVGFGSLACIVSLALMYLHATHYSKPHQQRHILRILFMIPIYAAVSVVSYKWYKHALYWEVLRDCYEAFAISSFFSLLCNYLEDNLTEQKNYFRQIEPKNWVWPVNWWQKCTGGKHKGIFRIPRSGLTWFNIIWISIYQYCLIRIICTFVAMITQFIGVYCQSSLSPAFAQVWVSSINATSVTVAMYCLIQFYVQLKDVLAPERPFLKVACIKLVIFFSFWQVLLISFLSSGEKPVITTGPRVSYVDVKVGIPCVLLTFEMSIFSLLHIWAFPWRRYIINPSTAGPTESYQGGFLGLHAFYEAFNPWDIIKASARGFRWLFVGARRRHADPSYDPSYKLQRQNTYAKEANLGKVEASAGTRYYETEQTSAYQHNTLPHSFDRNMRPSIEPPGRPGVRRTATTDEDYNDNNPLLLRQGRTDGGISGPPTPRYQSQTGAYDRVPLSPDQYPQGGGGIGSAVTAEERVDIHSGMQQQATPLRQNTAGSQSGRRWDDRPR